jgi:hypothetical protein
MSMQSSDANLGEVTSATTVVQQCGRMALAHILETLCNDGTITTARLQTMAATVLQDDCDSEHAVSPQELAFASRIYLEAEADVRRKNGSDMASIEDVQEEAEKIARKERVNTASVAFKKMKASHVSNPIRKSIGAFTSRFTLPMLPLFTFLSVLTP